MTRIHTMTALAAALVFAWAAGTAQAAVFAKYDGVDGGSKDTNHDKWIDVLQIDWGSNKPGEGLTGQSRRRGGAVVEDITLTIEYEKASPKLQEACANGTVFDRVVIHEYVQKDGKTEGYYTIQLEKVRITSYSLSGDSDNQEPPQVVIGNNFEEIKVTYTELPPNDSTAPEKEAPTASR